MGATLKLCVKDVYPQGCHMWVRLDEKSSKHHDMHCHHTLEAYIVRISPVRVSTQPQKSSLPEHDLSHWTVPDTMM